MGQRNATYIIISNSENGVIKDLRILPIYNQWNFVRIQSCKMVRGIKSVLKLNNFNITEFDFTGRIPIEYIYFTNAGVNTYKDKQEDKIKKLQWVGGYIETNCYKDGTYDGPFEEDNNNGWNIIKFIFNQDTQMIDAEIYCVVGTEDEDNLQSNTLYTYFNDKNNKRELKYLSQFKWNPELVEDVRTLITTLTNK